MCNANEPICSLFQFAIVEDVAVNAYEIDTHVYDLSEEGVAHVNKDTSVVETVSQN
jgi:hypothetical protein